MKFKLKYLGVLGFIIFIWILTKIDFNELGKVLSNTNYWFLIPAFLFFIISLVGNFLRWHYIVNWFGIKITRRDAITFSFQSLFAEHTPGKVGEPIVKAIYLKDKTKSSLSDSLFTTFFHRFIDLWSTFIQAVIVIIVLLLIFKIKTTILAPSLIFFAIFIISLFILIYNRKITVAIVKHFFKRFDPGKYKGKIKKNLINFYKNFERVNKRVIIVSFLYDLVVVILTSISLLFISLAINYSVPFIHLIMVVPILTVAVGLPISIAGIGLREATFVYYFSLLGARPEIGILFGLIFFLFRTLSIFPGLIISLVRR